MAEQVIITASQRSSKPQAQSFSQNNSMKFPVSAGKVLKGVIVQLKGYITPSFGGAVTLHQHGIMDALIAAVSYVDDAGNTHKKVTPRQMRFQQRILNGQTAPEYYKVNSTSLGNAPTKGTDATPFALGTTGQSVAFVSALEVSFENKLSTFPSRTFLPTKGNVSSYIQIDTKAFSNIEKIGGSVITACLGDVQVEIKLLEAPAELATLGDYDVFRQSFIQNSIPAVLNQFMLQLSTNGRVQGLQLAFYEGAGRDGISMDKAANTRIKVIKDGVETIHDTTLLNLMLENLAKKSQDDVVPGTAYLSFLNNMDYSTALPANSFKTLHLELTTDPTMVVSPAAMFEIGIDEILPAFANNNK